MDRDAALDTLLDLDGQILVLDEEGRHWVRFVVRRVPVTPEKLHGLDYSLTLHAADGARLVRFDNAHPVRAGAGPGGTGGPARDHKHRLRRSGPTTTVMPPAYWRTSGPRSKPF